MIAVLFRATGSQILFIRAKTSSTRIDSIRPSRAVITLTCSPSGAHTLAFVGPNNTTVGAPTAAARCETPVSCPIKRVQLFNAPTRSSRSAFVRVLRVSNLLFERNSCTATKSASPPTRRTSWNINSSLPIKSIQCLIGQFFFGAPLPT